MKITNYKIMYNYYGGPFYRDQYTGISFTSEKVAQEYIDTFISDKQFYSIEKSSFESYNSIEELLKERPELQVKALKYSLSKIKDSVELPFTLNCHNDRYVDKFDKLSLKDLDSLIENFEFDIKDFYTEEKFEEKNQEDSEYLIYWAKHFLYTVRLKYSQYEQLKELSAKTHLKIEEIEKNIKRTEKAIEIKKIEEKYQDDEIEM